jgi:hypothetical protein
MLRDGVYAADAKTASEFEGDPGLRTHGDNCCNCNWRIDCCLWTAGLPLIASTTTMQGTMPKSASHVDGDMLQHAAACRLNRRGRS